MPKKLPSLSKMSCKVSTAKETATQERNPIRETARPRWGMRRWTMTMMMASKVLRLANKKIPEQFHMKRS